MRRTRRDVLGVAGLSLALAAGCLERSDGSGTPTDTETPADTQTPTDTPALPDDLQRVDEPPYEIDAGECDYPESDRDPLYLCANMTTEPSLSFTQTATSGGILDDGGLELGDGDDNDDWIYTTLLTDEDDRNRLTEDSDGEPAQLIREADFDTQAILVVQTGWGSSSVQPHFERVETTDTGVHAFGCHTDPCIQTSDLTSRTTVVRFERPETLESGVVSLTVAPDERWNVATGEGVVTIPDN